MPKGEKIRAKQEMDQLPLENFENNRIELSRIELLFCQNPLTVSFCQKLASCGENSRLWEKG
jgi:hypothetical protein